MELLEYLFIFLATGLLILFTTWLINRNRKGVKRCKLGWGMHLFNIAGTLIFLTLTLVIYVPDFFLRKYFEEPTSGEQWFGPIFVVLTGLAIYVFIDGFFREIRWDENGLTTTKLFTPPRTYEWEDVDSLNYNFLVGAWNIGFSDSKKFFFYELMGGAYAFIKACEEHASPKSNMGLARYVGR